MVQQVLMDKMSNLISEKPLKTVKSRDSGKFENMLRQTTKSTTKGANDTAKQKNGEASELEMCATLGVSGGAFDFATMQDALQMMCLNQTIQNGMQSDLTAQMPTITTPPVNGIQITESLSDGMPITSALLPNADPKSPVLPFQEMQRPNTPLAVSLPQNLAPIRMEGLDENFTNPFTMDADGAKKVVTTPSELAENASITQSGSVAKVVATAPGSVEKTVITPSGPVEKPTLLSNTTTLKTVHSADTVVFHNSQRITNEQGTKAHLVSEKSESKNVLGDHEAVNKDTTSIKPMQEQNVLQKLPYDAAYDTKIEEKGKIYEYVGIGTQKNPHEGLAVESKSTMGFHHVLRTSQNELPVSEQITQKILANRAQEKEFVMQLFPKELGQVTVKMVIQNSTLVVELCAANPKAQSLILSNADDIRNILQTQNQRDTQVFVPTMQKDYTEQFQNRNQNQQNPHEQPQQKSRNESDEQELMSTQGFLSALKALENREEL